MTDTSDANYCIFDFFPKAIFIDLETNVKGEIWKAAAWSKGWSQEVQGSQVAGLMKALDSRLDSASMVCGHNILKHDLPILRKVFPDLTKIANAPALDSLFLSPIAFPKKPYHSLVKNKNLTSEKNSPLSDCEVSAHVLSDALKVFSDPVRQATDLYKFIFTCMDSLPEGGNAGIQRLTTALGITPLVFNSEECLELLKRVIGDTVCKNYLQLLWEQACKSSDYKIALAYVTAWLPVAGGDSIIPAWVAKQFSAVEETVMSLRRRSCGDPSCFYCNTMHNPTRQLKRWFGFDAFRPKPGLPEDPEKSLQEAIVTSGMNGESLLAILPTGGGKSLCFQLPALYRYNGTGALTIVICPLQALMKDQVENLKKRSGIYSTEALYGLLTMAERRMILEEIALGSIGLLYVSPEQLRSKSFRNAIINRKIDCWVYDEAHCLSKWGHDFRPDYLYVARFIKELIDEQNAPSPCICCVTATAKRDVQEEICQHIQDHLGIRMRVFDGGSERSNLKYQVEEATSGSKIDRIHALLEEHIGVDCSRGSAVIFCSTRMNAENIAEGIGKRKWPVLAFHAGLDKDEKKVVFERFMGNEVKVIVATNAFGMGVDKPDVRVVIHADAPGSLENYLQEAGRAGRDGKSAECILLFNKKDLEKQFGLSSYSQLRLDEIKDIWRAIYKSDRKKTGEVVLTASEILGKTETISDIDDFHQTKMNTAISVLEKQGFLERNENRPIVFQGHALVRNYEEGVERISRLNLSQINRKLWEAYLDIFLKIEGDANYSLDQFVVLPETDEAINALCKAQGKQISPYKFVIHVLNEMSSPGAGLLQKGISFSAWVSAGKGRNAQKKLAQLNRAENSFLGILREMEPDVEGWSKLYLPSINQKLSAEIPCTQDTLIRFLKEWEKDPQNISANSPNLEIKPVSKGQYALRLITDWQQVAEAMKFRNNYLSVLVEFLLSKAGKPGILSDSDVLVEFSERDVMNAFSDDMYLNVYSLRNPGNAILAMLTFLHKNEIIKLQNGKALISTAMTLKINPEKIHQKRMMGFSKGDFSGMSAFYEERILQIHIVSQYAKIATEKVAAHIRLIADYFSLSKTEFSKRYLTEKADLYRMATSIESYQQIVEKLNNPDQKAIVSESDKGNRIILAGPGSGKTRVIVHRCAFLLRVRRVYPKSILVLCFNHNACLELRRRIYSLVDEDAYGVIISTYYGLALRLLGRSLVDLPFQKEAKENKLPDFKAILREATKWLQNEKEVVGVESDQLRERLLGDIQHILVDEYQDVDADEYAFIQALSGARLEGDQHRKPTLLAVGDDDQAIYKFKGANIRYIQQFCDDYSVKKHEKHELLENYRSTSNIIETSNRLIAWNKNRMKEHPIRINQARKYDPGGGVWEQLDSLNHGKVQILEVKDAVDEALAVVQEIKRLQCLNSETDWSKFAVLSRGNQDLVPIRSLLMEHGIAASFDPVSFYSGQSKESNSFSIFRVREIARWLRFMRDRSDERWKASDVCDYLKECCVGESSWYKLLSEISSEWYGINGDRHIVVPEICAFFVDALLERKQQRSFSHGVLLSTVHRAKGLEFDHVFILDGFWPENYDTDDLEEERRIYYVGMTRAIRTLTLIRRKNRQSIFSKEVFGNGTITHNISFFRDNSNNDWFYRRYFLLNLNHIYISYAGRCLPQDRIHKCLANISEGSVLQLEENKGNLFLCDECHRPIARLSQAGRDLVKSFEHIESIRVFAMFVRYKSDEKNAEYSARGMCDEWEIPICEIIYKSFSQSKTPALKSKAGAPCGWE